MEVDWNIIVPAIFGSGGALVGLINLWSSRRTTNKAKQVRDNYARIASVYRILETIRVATRASRVCVLKTENGGGIPAPGCDVKSSILYEAADRSSTKELQSAWQKVQLNGVWAQILQQIATERCATLTPDFAVGPHYDFLRESNCAKVHFVLIDITEPALFYLSIHLDAGAELSPQQESAAHQGVRQISQLFQAGSSLTESATWP